jgi:uncharacterized membrane protein
MNSLIHSPTGLVHLIACMISLLSGTFVLIMEKGTRTHKSIGYIYFIFMLIVNGTAFGLYHLFGRFGPFHIAALISLATLLAGMFPVLLRTNSWLNYHFAFMYYSVMGLYAAFASEVIVRIPGLAFGPAVGIATAVVMITAMIFFQKLSKKWISQYSSTSIQNNNL